MLKNVYPYEYMDDWAKFIETTLYSSLNMKDITDVDYMHVNIVWKDFEIKHLGEYHDFYHKSDILLLGDVFENFREMCLKIYHLDPLHFFQLLD